MVSNRAPQLKTQGQPPPVPGKVPQGHPGDAGDDAGRDEEAGQAVPAGDEGAAGIMVARWL